MNETLTVKKKLTFEECNYYGITKLKDLDNAAIQAILDMESSDEIRLSEDYRNYFKKRLKI